MRPPGLLDELSRERRDAGHVLEEIQRRALRGEKRRRAAAHTRARIPGLTRIAVRLDRFEHGLGVDLIEHFPRDVEPGQHAPALGQKNAARPHVGGDDRLGRDVAGAEVLGNRPAHQVAIQSRIERGHDPAGVAKSTLGSGPNVTRACVALFPASTSSDTRGQSA